MKVAAIVMLLVCAAAFVWWILADAPNKALDLLPPTLLGITFIFLRVRYPTFSKPCRKLRLGSALLVQGFAQSSSFCSASHS